MSWGWDGEKPTYVDAETWENNINKKDQMTAQSPKPREFWVSPFDMKTAFSISPHRLAWEVKNPNQNGPDILCREVTKDEIRVNREDWEDLKTMLMNRHYELCTDSMANIERESCGG